MSGAATAAGSVCGTKIGGSFLRLPGVHDAERGLQGIENGTSDLKVARRTRGTGTLAVGTMTPCQFMGRRMLPAGSIVNRDS